MVKNVFALLKDHEKIWVNIMLNKYVPFKIWNGHNLDKATVPSYIVILICKIAQVLAPSLQIKSLNPNNASFDNDPCCSKLRLSLNSTFFNMDFYIDNISFGFQLLQQERCTGQRS